MSNAQLETAYLVLVGSGNGSVVQASFSLETVERWVEKLMD